jgi:Holliday junction resolvase
MMHPSHAGTGEGSYCGKECARLARLKVMPACKQCGKPIKRGASTFCGKRCFGLSRKGIGRPGKWKDMTEPEARQLFEQYKRAGVGLTEFASHRRHEDPASMGRVFTRFFPAEYENVIEDKLSKTYQRGRAFEYRVRDVYRGMGYFVLRSARSLSPVDLMAVKKGEVLGIQCKLSTGMTLAEKDSFVQFCAAYGIKPVFVHPDSKRRLVHQDLSTPSAERTVSELVVN